MDLKVTKKTDPKTYYVILLALLLIGASGLIWYFFDQSETRAAEIVVLQGEIRATEAELAAATGRVTELEQTLSQVRDDLEELEDDYRDEKNKNDEFEDQIRNITGTVRDLDKLSKTDVELLQKYSKVYFLNENFVPSDLDRINDRYVLDGKDPMYFHGDAVDFLEDMLQAADRAGHKIRVVSAYRSFDHQQQLKGEFTTVYGNGANTFSADQGYSEHQLGTTMDLTTPEIGATEEGFAETDAYQWLINNAYKYGFTLSYPENNTFYVFEPWHWRFVGVDLAKDLDRAGDHFYDWEQRKIDEYLLTIFD